MIPAGVFPPNPTELLGNERFVKLLKAVKDVFAYVIVDTPPIGRVIDAAVIAKVCDGTVLVLKSDGVTRSLAKTAAEQIRSSNENILGVVLNKVERKNQKGYYNKYYGSQKYEGYYGHSEETKNA